MEGFNRSEAKQDVDSTRIGGGTMLQMILFMHSRGKQHKDITAWEAAPWPYLPGALRMS